MLYIIFSLIDLNKIEKALGEIHDKEIIPHTNFTSQFLVSAKCYFSLLMMYAMYEYETSIENLRKRNSMNRESVFAKSPKRNCILVANAFIMLYLQCIFH